MLAFLFISNLY